jgi:hypothetical protein
MVAVPRRAAVRRCAVAALMVVVPVPCAMRVRAPDAVVRPGEAIRPGDAAAPPPADAPVPARVAADVVVPPDAAVRAAALVMALVLWPSVPAVRSRAVPSSGFGWVSQATAAPAMATGHSTTPATPSSPAPVYTAMRRPRGDTLPTASSVPSAALLTIPAPGTRRNAEPVMLTGFVTTDDGFSRVMTLPASLKMGLVHGPEFPRNS